MIKATRKRQKQPEGKHLLSRSSLAPFYFQTYKRLNSEFIVDRTVISGANVERPVGSAIKKYR